jgi:excisionase family DNA binding protein
MGMLGHLADNLTTQQAAEYLQVNRKTIYRYIRQGKLLASRFGRSHSILRRSVELLLWSARTGDDISFRDYSAAECGAFLDDDQPDAAARAVMQRFGVRSDPPDEAAYPLSVIRDLATDMGAPNLAEQHNRYTCGRRALASPPSTE